MLGLRADSNSVFLRWSPNESQRKHSLRQATNPFCSDDTHPNAASTGLSTISITGASFGEEEKQLICRRMKAGQKNPNSREAWLFHNDRSNKATLKMPGQENHILLPGSPMVSITQSTLHFQALIFKNSSVTRLISIVSLGPLDPHS